MGKNIFIICLSFVFIVLIIILSISISTIEKLREEKTRLRDKFDKVVDREQALRAIFKERLSFIADTDNLTTGKIIAQIYYLLGILK